jgi:hypothetical protein
VMLSILRIEKDKGGTRMSLQFGCIFALSNWWVCECDCTTRRGGALDDSL